MDDRFDPAIRIVEYDVRWPSLAEAELRSIRDALGAVVLRCEHIGSTAVPGLAAKPIIDLQVSVDSIDLPNRYVQPLERLGYLFAPTPDSSRHHFFAKPHERPRTYHLHVVEGASEHELRHLAVRDFLREHAYEATRYEAVKREVARTHLNDRLSYIEGKHDYMVDLERCALSWAHNGCQ